MKLFRLTLVCSLLLLAATPTFAIACRTCDHTVEPVACVATPYSGTRCIIHFDGCEEIYDPLCTSFAGQAAAAMLAEWTVASIEISRPAEGVKVVTSQDAVTEAGVSTTNVQR